MISPDIDFSFVHPEVSSHPRTSKKFLFKIHCPEYCSDIFAGKGNTLFVNEEKKCLIVILIFNYLSFKLH